MRWKRLMPVVLATPVLYGCVLQSTFDAKEAELAACAEQLKTEAAAAEEGRIAIEQCAKARETTRVQSERLAARETSLREQLHTELLARDVEISQLKGQLSVRVLDKILFRSGSADILPTGQAVLDKLAGVLAATDDMIRVEGHTDFVPIGKQLRQKYYSNWELSAARATSVVRYFEHRHGIDPTRMEAVGFSMFRPVAGDETPEGRQRNRRVEIMLAAPRAPAANE